MRFVYIITRDVSEIRKGLKTRVSSRFICLMPSGKLQPLKANQVTLQRVNRTNITMKLLYLVIIFKS